VQVDRGTAWTQAAKPNAVVNPKNKTDVAVRERHITVVYTDWYSHQSETLPTNRSADLICRMAVARWQFQARMRQIVLRLLLATDLMLWQR